MQGIVTDQNGTYVKAAILKLIKLNVINSELETDDGIVIDAEMESVTYVEADNEGRFVIQGMNSEEKYIVEIFLEQKESEVVVVDMAEPEAEPEPENLAEVVEVTDAENQAEVVEMTEQEREHKAEELNESELEAYEDYDETEDFPENIFEIDLIDSVNTGAVIDNDFSEKRFVKDQYNLTNIKDKLYMRRTNLW